MKRLAVLTSGGDAPGMNAAVRAVTLRAAREGCEVFGVDSGYEGLIANRIDVLTPRNVHDLVHRGGTVLHTARCAAFLEPEGRARAAANIAERGIEGLLVIGGDGSYRGAEELHSEHGVPCIGIPGTIDNDIGGTEYTIGFDTAVNTAVSAMDKLRDTAESHDRLFFIEMMGRHSGAIAMMSGIAGGADAILVPETPTDIEALIESLRAGKAAGVRAHLVVVSEGDEAGDAYAIAKKVAGQSEFKDSRVTVVGHLQRGGAPTGMDRVVATRMGAAAVEAILSGRTGEMVALRGGAIELRPIAEAWEKPSGFDQSYPVLFESLRTY